MIQKIQTLILAHPELVALVMALVVWPTLTGLASLVQDRIARRYPKAWAVLQASGFDLLGLIRRFRGLPATDVRTMILSIDVGNAATKAAYDSYSKALGGINHAGLPLPAWDDLSPQAKVAFEAFGKSIRGPE